MQSDSAHKKICSVIRDLQRESGISPNPTYAYFQFNTTFVGGGVPIDREERSILRKLREEGHVKIHLPFEHEHEKAQWSAYTEDELLERFDTVYVELLPSFHSYARKFCQRGARRDLWKYTNPFWILFFLFESLFCLVRKISWQALSIIVTFLGLLFIDYSQGFENLNALMSWFERHAH